MKSSIRLGIAIAVALSASLLAPSAFAQPITVTTTNDANTLANAITGSGVNITNATYTGAAVAAGTFTGGTAAGLGFDSGIVLTSGSAAIAGQTNNSDSATANNGLAGWAPLNALVPGYETHDATLLNIEFTTTGGDLFFNYVFGSEEYNEYVNSSFNDVFGFFVDGTLVANNIALLPGGSTAVAINNVNNGANAAYYRDNDGTGLYPNMQYDGLTTVLTASALGLGAGTHSITLAIADSGDWILDSGVFIQGGSFSDTETPPGVPDSGTTVGLLGLALLGGAALRRFLAGV